MRVVGLKTLKNKLSEYVRMAARGETILVTDRDHVVAEIVAPRLERAPMVADALLADAVRKGWLTPALLAGAGAPPSRPAAKLREILVELERDRQDR